MGCGKTQIAGIGKERDLILKEWESGARCWEAAAFKLKSDSWL